MANYDQLSLLIDGEWLSGGGRVEQKDWHGRLVAVRGRAMEGRLRVMSIAFSDPPGFSALPSEADIRAAPMPKIEWQVVQRGSAL